LFDKYRDLKILLTVSPVRHWKDGAHGNQLSKASLLLAAESLVEAFPDKVFYFPSYEIVMDELRDYRFYADDMLHVSNRTIAYIWEKLKTVLISGESLRVMEKVEPLLKMLEHRPRNKDAKTMEKLEGKRSAMTGTLMDQFPYLNWKKLPD
jgi:hypothetical protein